MFESFSNNICSYPIKKAHSKVYLALNIVTTFKKEKFSWIKTAGNDFSSLLYGITISPLEFDE